MKWLLWIKHSDVGFTELSLSFRAIDCSAVVCCFVLRITVIERILVNHDSWHALYGFSVNEVLNFEWSMPNLAAFSCLHRKNVHPNFWIKFGIRFDVRMGRIMRNYLFNPRRLRFPWFLSTFDLHRQSSSRLCEMRLMLSFFNVFIWTKSRKKRQAKRLMLQNYAKNTHLNYFVACMIFLPLILGCKIHKAI